jgi:hypothetical protein
MMFLSSRESTAAHKKKVLLLQGATATSTHNTRKWNERTTKGKYRSAGRASTLLSTAGTLVGNLLVAEKKKDMSGKACLLPGSHCCGNLAGRLLTGCL